MPHVRSDKMNDRGGGEGQRGRAGGSFGTVNAIQGYGEMPRHGYPVRRH